MKDKQSVLFLEKVFIRPFLGQTRGVELFNFSLVQQLVQRDIHVCLLIHHSWKEMIGTVFHETEGKEPEIVYVSSNPVNILFSLNRFSCRRFNVLLAGNVANSFILLLSMLRMMRIAPRCVVIAHRRPSRGFLYAQKLWRDTTVVAVNSIIANDFRKAGFRNVAVYYGIINADKFYPRESPLVNEHVNFCVLGYLDSPWKGVDTVVSAFTALPEQVKKRCMLHLASFSHPPSFTESNIKTYSWLSPDTVPEFLRNMDVMIVPSRDEKVIRETFSQAMVQGMLTGLPVVVNNVPVLTEKINNGGGLVFSNVSELTEIIILLTESPELRKRLGRMARKVAIERYVWNPDFFVEHYLFPKDFIDTGSS